MIKTRDVSSPAFIRDIVLPGSPNWTAVVFFAVLGTLHLSNAIPAFVNQRWEGYLSMGLATVFGAAAMVSYLARFEVAFLPSQRRIRLRNGLRRMHLQRYIPFQSVHGVRLTLSHPSGRGEAKIEVLCDNEDIECPPTRIPRQEALCLAMMMGVRLIKVLPDGLAESDRSERF